ncbi:MAG: chorismate synthase [Coriobacteriia bacterium]|nr:chorismate synthase [Coriobacteriia bacterium]
MSSYFGKNIRIQIFGQSHSEALGVVIDGLPAGLSIDMQQVQTFLDRRRGGQNDYSTARAETDQPRIVSGLVNGVTCGAPLCALFENTDIRSKDYQHVAKIPRPSHVDYYAGVKYGDNHDWRGGGHFSGRMTVLLCFAGAVCLQLLNSWDVHIGAHIEQICTVHDRRYDPTAVSADELNHSGSFPVNDASVEEPMKRVMLDAAKRGDSVGGVIECAIIGLPTGIGNPPFDGIENCLTNAVFAIPAVRGIEFGMGFAAAEIFGSEHNDAFCIVDGQLNHKSNNAGGAVGGLTTGMPLIFRVPVKPTPSIAVEQDSVNLETMQETKLSVWGRHDPCIVPRAVPCIEAAAAIVLADMMAVVNRA